MNQTSKRCLQVAPLVLLLSGCTADLLYREEEVTPIPETSPATVQSIPWPLLSELADIIEATPKTAIRLRVGYKRRMGLFRVEKSGTLESKVEKQGENYKSERKEELK